MKGNAMKKTLVKVAVMALIIAATVVISWRATMLSLSIDVTDDTAYISSFGHTDTYDYEPDF